MAVREHLKEQSIDGRQHQEVQDHALDVVSHGDVAQGAGQLDCPSTRSDDVLHDVTGIVDEGRLKVRVGFFTNPVANQAWLFTNKVAVALAALAG